MKSRSILFKTRTYVIVLLGLLLSALVTEWQRLSSLESQIKRLSAQTSPLLTNTGLLAQVSSSLRVVSDKVRVAETPEELDETRAVLSRVLEDIDLLLQEEEFPHKLRQDTAETFERLLSAQADAISARLRIEANKQVAIDALNAMSNSLLPDHQALMLAVLQVKSTGQVPKGSLRGFEDFLMISEMKVSIARLSILTSTLGTFDQGRPDVGRAHVIRDIGVLAARSARLQGLELRRTTATQLAQFRDAMIADGGVLDGVAALDAAGARRDAALDQASRFAVELAAQLNEDSRRAAAGFQEAAVNSAIAIRTVLWQKLLLTVTLVALVAWFAWVVIERGLIARLSRLAVHVRDMANGQVEHALPVTGADEVGEIEQAVETSRRMARALHRTNEELERFAYVAAHDLRSPLRAVSDLVAWTQEDYETALPAGAKDNLQLIDGRVKRMSNHLTALLDYARAGQSEMTPAMLNLEDFVEDLRAVYMADDNFELRLSGQVTSFETYVAPVKTILINLVSNAVKHHDRPQGEIELAVRCDGECVEIDVRDDGPGIATEHHKRIFELFQTLQLKQGTNSTGLGLAVVKKLSASLGGTVTIHSNPDQERGTTFTVRLPVGDAAKAMLGFNETLGGLAA